MKPRKFTPHGEPARQNNIWSATTSKPALNSVEANAGARPVALTPRATPKPVAKKNTTGAKLPTKTSAPANPVVASLVERSR